MTWLRGPARPRGTGLMSYAAAIDALGTEGAVSRDVADVPVTSIVGSVARPNQFDADFGLRGRHSDSRLRRVEAAASRGKPLPAVDLIRLGELFFVVDGHHRVAAARRRDQHEIEAHVRHICTVAYAMCCLRAEHLASKAAEREFLGRIPLDDDVRRRLWLDRPQDWSRLADSAEAWALAYVLEGRRDILDRCGLARAWWREEVTPLVRRLRGSRRMPQLRDVELYAAALDARDRLGRARWPEDVAPLLEALRTTLR